MDFFWRTRPWYGSQFMRAIKPIDNINTNTAIFLTGALNKHKQPLKNVLVRNVEETFNDSCALLPVTGNSLPDYEKMSEIALGIRQEKLRVISRYLNHMRELVARTSTVDENLQGVMSCLTWGDFRMGDIFSKIKTKKIPYKAGDLPKNPTGNFTIPCLTSSFLNQGLNYYAPKNDVEIIQDVISLPSNSDVYRAYYQSRDFAILSDAYAISHSSRKLSIGQNLFLVAAINKFSDLPIYSHKQKLGGWNTVQNKTISLPVDSVGNPDYRVMDKICGVFILRVLDRLENYLRSSDSK
ncbi:hypothetical protein ACUY3J_11420 [Corynebacterium segmentosum]